VTARRVAALASVLTLAACDNASDGAAPATWAPTGDAAEVSTKLCETVRAWADGSVDAVNGFRLASPTLDAPGRKARYGQAFGDQLVLDERLSTALDALTLPERVRARLAAAMTDVRTTVDDNAAHAAGLPDSAYRFEAVSEGTLLTGTEKAKAVVFQALSELAGDPSTGVPRGCGRRAALDISPPATFPP
jgi:hypothetical protein